MPFPMLPPSGRDPRTWPAALARYHRPKTARSIFEIVITVVPFVTLWAMAALAFVNGYWWGLILTAAAAGFLVCLFVLQHDCVHAAPFSQRTANDWTERILEIFILMPYDY
jgi:omega-6 fatty acid desaturase (delta-12 desaturase)